MFYTHVLAPHKECKHYALQTYMNKNKYKYKIWKKT